MKDTSLFCKQCSVSLLRIKWAPLLQIRKARSCVSFLFNKYSWCETVPNYYKKKKRNASNTFKQWLIGVILGWGERPIERSQGNHKRVSVAVDLPGVQPSPPPTFFFFFLPGQKKGRGWWGAGRRNSRRLKGGLTEAGRDKQSKDRSGGSRGER